MAAHIAMDGRPFVEQLKIEMEAYLGKLNDAPPIRTSTGAAADVSTLLNMALKNEIEAAQIAAEWAATTPELEAKLALAQHAGDEARHYRLLADKIQGLGAFRDDFDPLVPPSPVLTYLRSLQTTVERIAGGLVAREAMGGRRNAQFLKFLEASGREDIAQLYRDVINPDEERHHQAGCALLARLATTPETQEAARRAALRLLEIGDQVRTAAMEKTSAPVVPGC